MKLINVNIRSNMEVSKEILNLHDTVLSDTLFALCFQLSENLSASSVFVHVTFCFCFLIFPAVYDNAL